MRIFENANFAFVQNRRKAYIFSAILFVLSFISFATRGLEMGIDFKGGTEFIVTTQGELNVAQVREALTPVLGVEPEVISYGEAGIGGSTHGLMVRTPAEGDINTIADKVSAQLQQSFPEAKPRIERTEVVGPRFAEDLQRGAMYSIVGSLFVIFFYVLVRFEWRYGIGALVSLFHDVILTLGFFSAFHGILPFSLQIDQTIIAAFLTIVGYSINDTVVVFDRVREFRQIFKTEPLDEVMNRSINNMLGRTIVTGGATLLTLVVLIIFGGEVLRGFSVALLLGILFGTYSSVYVAAPVMLEIKNWEARRRR